MVDALGYCNRDDIVILNRVCHSTWQTLMRSLIPQGVIISKWSVRWATTTIDFDFRFLVLFSDLDSQIYSYLALVSSCQPVTELL